MAYTATEPCRSVFLNNLDEIRIRKTDLESGAYYSPVYGKQGVYYTYQEYFRYDPRGPSEFLDIDDNINISFHIRAIEQSQAIKMVKRKNTDIDKMKIEENKKAVRSGYDMDILPSDLITYGEDVKSLLISLSFRILFAISSSSFE